MLNRGSVLETSKLEGSAVWWGEAATVLVGETGITCEAGAVAPNAGSLEEFLFRFEIKVGARKRKYKQK